MESVNRRVTRSMTTPRKQPTGQDSNTDHLKTPLRLANKFPVSRSARKPRTRTKVREEVLENVAELDDDYSPQSIAARSEDDEGTALDDISSKAVASPIAPSPPRTTCASKTQETNDFIEDRVVVGKEDKRPGSSMGHIWLVVLAFVVLLFAVNTRTSGTFHKLLSPFKSADTSVPPSASSNVAPSPLTNDAVVAEQLMTAPEPVETTAGDNVIDLLASQKQRASASSIASQDTVTKTAEDNSKSTHTPSEAVSSRIVSALSRSHDQVKAEEAPTTPARKESADKVEAEEAPATPARKEAADKVEAEEAPATPARKEAADKVRVEEAPATPAREKPADKVKAEEAPATPAREKTADKVKAEEAPATPAREEPVEKVTAEKAPATPAREKQVEKVKVEDGPATPAREKAADKVKADEAQPASSAEFPVQRKTPQQNVEENKNNDSRDTPSKTTPSDAHTPAKPVNSAKTMRSSILRDATLEKLRNRAASVARDRPLSSNDAAAAPDTGSNSPAAAARRPGAVKCGRDPVTKKLVCGPQ